MKSKRRRKEELTMPKYIDVDSSAYDYGTLVDWLISSVGLEPPVWTEPHIEELLEDFYVVPKSTPQADVVPVRHGTWINADEQPYFRKHYHAKVCSECGKRKDGKWLYCPYCGSKNQDGGHDDG